ncbi:MAG: LAGLIDADG family homing endonuclease [Candidatus Taylorbacteria bacterium]
MGRTKPQSVSADYIVGLTDGEGCFYVLLNKSSLYRTGYGVHLHFHIKMQEADREVLIKVRNSLGCGEVYFQNEKRLNHVHCYRYTVAAHRDIIEKIVPFFESHPLQTVTKKKNFELFAEIAEIVGKGEHLTSNGIDKIIKLKAMMNQRTVDSRSAGNPLATSKAVK